MGRVTLYSVLIQNKHKIGMVFEPKQKNSKTREKFKGKFLKENFQNIMLGIQCDHFKAM